MTVWERCSTCVQSARFPKIQFDEQGVCNFCRNEFGELTDDTVIETARATIKELLRTTPRTSEYDAVMCYSGGKDSTYVLKLAVEQYGLRVMAATLDNGFLAGAAMDNIHKVVDHLGVDLVVFRPAKKRFASILRASMLFPIYSARSLTRISASCNSCISMVNMMALKLALEKHIPFILAGFTLGQIPANGIIYKNNYRFLQESREASLNKLRASAGAFVNNYYTIKESTLAAVESYPTTMNLLCLETISEDEIIQRISQIGWQRPGDVDGCSSNCRLNTLNNYVHQQTYGYNPYELELSYLIRKGLMTRAEALSKLSVQPEDQRVAIQQELGILDSEIAELSNRHE